jgi:hypothetical protein
VFGGLRFLYFYSVDGGVGHVQSVVLTSLCITLGTLLYMMGFIADLIATNRKLLERIHLQLRSASLEKGASTALAPSHETKPDDSTRPR